MGRYRAGDRIREEYVDVIEYRDTGCEISDLCTSCPLPQCKHDDANWYRRYKKLAKQHFLLKKLTVPVVNYSVLAEHHHCRVETVKRLHEQVLANNINLKVIEVLHNTLNKEAK